MSSKIKVDTIENVAGSGNVSLGSGHNLVVPGNITGSGTATITGDLTVDTSSLKVNASNNFIGIGTASPQKKVHILDTTSDGIIIFDRNGTSTDHQIVFAHNYQSGGQSGGNYYGIGVDGSENKLVFAYDANSQASLSADAKMLMDASGRVTKPSQPSFLAFGANIGEESTAGYIQYPNITAAQGGHNIGSHYNTSTSKFTAPIAGKYLFGFSVYAHTTNALDMYGKINDSANVSGHQVNAGSNDDNYPTLSGSVLINMAANDVFGWRMAGGSYHTNSTGSMFYGFLSH